MKIVFDDEKEAWYAYSQLDELEHAYAITIHKAQGKTLDRVIIDIDRGAFAHGQLYVALSRTRKKTDMYIKRTITEDDIIFSKRIKSFLE